ncbi:hypothetical protein PMAYCL1PPCAC_33365, partial [Pristionchus mayeri]
CSLINVYLWMYSLVSFLPFIASLELDTTTFPSFVGSTLVPQESQSDLNGTLYCPNYGDSISHCIQETTTYYNECCGVQHMYCCLKFKTWFIISFALALLVGICLAVLACYRYFKEDRDEV